MYFAEKYCTLHSLFQNQSYHLNQIIKQGRKIRQQVVESFSASIWAQIYYFVSGCRKVKHYLIPGVDIYSTLKTKLHEKISQAFIRMNNIVSKIGFKITLSSNNKKMLFKVCTYSHTHVWYIGTNQSNNRTIFKKQIN